MGIRKYLPYVSTSIYWIPNMKISTLATITVCIHYTHRNTCWKQHFVQDGCGEGIHSVLFLECFSPQYHSLESFLFVNFVFRILIVITMCDLTLCIGTFWIANSWYCSNDDRPTCKIYLFYKINNRCWRSSIHNHNAHFCYVIMTMLPSSSLYQKKCMQQIQANQYIPDCIKLIETLISYR